MHATFAPRDVRRALTGAASAADPKAKLEELRLVEVNAYSNGRMTFEAGSLNLRVAFVAPAEVKEDGGAIVNAKSLATFVRGVKSGQVTLTRADGSADVKAKNCVSASGWKHAAVEFPALPTVDGKACVIEASALASALAGGLLAVSTDWTREHLCRVNIDRDTEQKGRARIWSTDGHRVSICYVPATWTKGGADRLSIGGTQAEALARMVDGIPKDAPIVLARGGAAILAHGHDGEYLHAAVDQSVALSPIDQVIVAKVRGAVTFDRKAALDAIVGLMAQMESKAHGVAVMTRDNRLTVVDMNNDDNVVELPTAAATDGAVMGSDTNSGRVGFNAVYLRDALATCTSKRVRLQMSGELDPMRLDSIEDGKRSSTHETVITMPMRI